MSEAVVAALVGVGGAVLVAISGAITQIVTTKRVVDAERKRLDRQLHGEGQSRWRERREDRLLSALSELLAASDPQVAPGGDYGRAICLVHRLQLILNLDHELERSLNGALNKLALDLQNYVVVRERHIDEKLPETRALLEAHSNVTELGRRVVAQCAHITGRSS